MLVLLQALVAILLPVTVGMAIVLVLRYDVEAMI